MESLPVNDGLGDRTQDVWAGAVAWDLDLGDDVENREYIGRGQQGALPGSRTSRSSRESFLFFFPL